MTTTELLVVFFASCLGMFVKSVVGLGYPLFAIPLISLAIGVEGAVAVVSAPNLVANSTLCYRARSGYSESRDLGTLAVAGLIGAVIGTILLVSLPELPLILALIATIVAFLWQYLTSPDFVITPAVGRRWAPVAGGVMGLMQGAVGVGGPAIGVWLHGYRLSREAFVFSLTGLLILGGAAQVALLIADGAYTLDRAWGSAVALAAVALMVPVGARIRYRLSGPAFERAVVAVLVAGAIALLVRAFN